MKIKESQKKEIRALIAEFRDVLHLEHWDIDVAYHSEPDPESPACAANCTPKNEYRTATIRIFPNFWVELPESRRMIILHEMSHIITATLHNLITCAQSGQFVPPSVSSYHWEETTTWIAQIVSELKKSSK